MLCVTYVVVLGKSTHLFLSYVPNVRTGIKFLDHDHANFAAQQLWLFSCVIRKQTLRRFVMITTSEQAVTVTIWVLTGVGGFFAIRAARKKRVQRRGKPKVGSTDREKL
jgi:hypothetical protein